MNVANLPRLTWNRTNGLVLLLLRSHHPILYNFPSFALWITFFFFFFGCFEDKNEFVRRDGLPLHYWCRYLKSSCTFCFFFTIYYLYFLTRINYSYLKVFEFLILVVNNCYKNLTLTQTFLSKLILNKKKYGHKLDDIQESLVEKKIK